MTNPPAQSSNSILKAIALTGVALVLIVLIVLGGGGDPGRSGYLIGYLSAPFVISGIAVGIWGALAKRSWGWLGYSARFGIVAAGVFVVSAANKIGGLATRVTPMTEAERQHLVVEGTEARHTDFGFALTLPSAGYVHSAELEEQSNKEFANQGLTSNHIWVLEDPAQPGMVMVLVIKGAGNNEAAMRGAARGMRRGIAKADARVVEDTVIWESATREYRFTAAFANGAYLRVRCLTAPKAVVCIQAVSPDSSGLQGVREQLRVVS